MDEKMGTQKQNTNNTVAKKTKKQKQPYFNAERKARIVFSILVSIAIPFIVFIGAPLQIYCSNIEEFRFIFTDVIGQTLLFFFGCSLIFFCSLFFVPELAYKILRGIYLGLAFMLFLQSNYLNGGLHSLSGDTSQSVIEMAGMPAVVFNTVLWSAVIVGFTLASVFVKKKDIVGAVSLVLAVMVMATQTINTGVTAITTDFAGANAVSGMKKEDPEYVPTFLTTSNLTTVAEDRNVVLFVIDRFDSKKYYETNKNIVDPYLKDWGGFTYFEDHISMYGRTYPSLAYMLTRNKLENGQGRKQYFIDSYGNNQTLSKLHEQGYSVNLYTDSYYGYYDAFYLPDYIDNKIITSEESLRREVVQEWNLFRSSTFMGLYRILPHVFKDTFGTTSSAIVNQFVVYTSDDLTHPQASTDLKQAYQEVTRETFTANGDKQFTCFHVSGCHDVFYDTDWSKAPMSKRKDIKISLINSFAILNEYIKEMKRLGVYDNSTIIITGDHGFEDSRTGDLIMDKITALFVKRAGETEAKVKKSKAQVSHDNLWATIFASEGIAFDEAEFGKSVFDVDENEDQVRSHVWQKFDPLYTHYEEQVFEIKGTAREFKNWTIKSKKKINKELYS